MFIINSPQPKSELDLLHYEIRMLNEVFPLGYHPKDDVDKSARLESFLVHARNLIDFLENNGSKPDDLLISNFVDEKGKKINKIVISLSADLKEKINKHLQHLTTTRMKEKPGWIIELIWTSINQGLADFFNRISSQYFPTLEKRNKEDFINLVSVNLIFS